MKKPLIKTLVCIGLLIGSHHFINAQEQESFQKLVKLPVREAAYDSYLALMRINIEQSRKEDGNISFTLFGKDGDYTVYLLERFKNKADWEEHKKSVHGRSTDAISPAATMHLSEETILKEIPEIPAADTEILSPEENTQNIITWFTVQPTATTAFIEAMSKAIPKARDTEGNLGYNIYQNAEDPNKFIVIERWRNPEVYQNYLQSEYSKKLNQDVEGLLNKEAKLKREVLKNISE